jgi:hypothetical protein
MRQEFTDWGVMPMEKPTGTHAGCGGVVAVLGWKHTPMLECEKCHAVLTDPRELAPRGPGQIQEPARGAAFDAVN